MAKLHGKRTVVKVDGSDISQYTDSSEIPRTKDSHDTTTYGNNSHRKSGGLLDGTFTCSGTYDTTAVTGPSAVLRPALESEDPVEIIHQPEGAGTGKPQDKFNAVCTKFTTTHPVADMVKWTAEFEIDGDVDDTPQV